MRSPGRPTKTLAVAGTRMAALIMLVRQFQAEWARAEARIRTVAARSRPSGLKSSPKSTTERSTTETVPIGQWPSYVRGPAAPRVLAPTTRPTPMSRSPRASGKEPRTKMGRAAGRERVGQDEENAGGALELKKKNNNN